MVITRTMLKNGTNKRFEHISIPTKGNEKKQIKKIKNQYNLNSLPILTYQKKTLKQFKKILHQRKFDLIHRKESKQGMINPNNKNLIIKLGYGVIKEIGRASCRERV